MTEDAKLVGLAGLFDEPDALVRAAERVRDAGFRNWDCHTPYPVHGLDEAMGLKPSFMPYVTLAAAFGGAIFAKLMQWWMSAVDYPLMVGGKPLFSLPAFAPVTFELFVLFAALTTFAATLAACKLLRWHSPLHDNGLMAEVTGSRFAVVLEARDERFSKAEARALLEAAGCEDVRPLYEIEEAPNQAGDAD